MSWLVKTEDTGGGGIPNTIGTDYKPGSLESTMHWQVIWPRAIALAWEEPEFHAALKADPRKAIHTQFGYELNDALDLEITDAPDGATFDPSASSGDKPGDPWESLPPLKLILSIPPAPPAEMQAVAITTYQDTGRTYPFTCC